MQEGALTLGGVCGPSSIYRLLGSLGYLADFAVPQVGDPFGHLAHKLTALFNWCPDSL